MRKTKNIIFSLNSTHFYFKFYELANRCVFIKIEQDDQFKITNKGARI